MQINDFIYHEKYGIGKITSLDGRFITVDFSDTQKQFLKSDGTKFLKPAIQNQFVVVSGELISYVGSSQKVALPHHPEPLSGLLPDGVQLLPPEDSLSSRMSLTG